MVTPNGVEQRTIMALPKDFLNKKGNEPFIKMLMEIALDKHSWVRGKEDRKEPDYFCNGIPFEFTLASDQQKKRSYNYIQKLKLGLYKTEDGEKDAFEYIEEAIKKKSKKEYATSNNHLCVLCVMDMTTWVMDAYGSVTFVLFDDRRKKFFGRIKKEFIDSGVFNNIFIIFPDFSFHWWVWDVLSDKKAGIKLTNEMIMSGEYPFICDERVYEAINAEDPMEELKKLLAKEVPQNEL